jgi:hypothetical protein
MQIPLNPRCKALHEVYISDDITPAPTEHDLHDRYVLVELKTRIDVNVTSFD